MSNKKAKLSRKLKMAKSHQKEGKSITKNSIFSLNAQLLE
jgi:hypothetical protein